MNNNATNQKSQEIEELITSHMSLVGHIVRETMGRVPAYVSRDDLTSAGLIALVQAAGSFDPARQVPFVRYASTRVRGAILDELRGIDWASRSVRRRARDVEASRTQLSAMLGRVPTIAEIATATGLSPAEVAANAEDVARARVVSLQGPGEHELQDQLPSAAPSVESLIERKEELVYLAESIAELPERLRFVVQEYFLAERPMAQIAKDLGVTESRVSQMRGEALSLLRGVLQQILDPELRAPRTRSEGCASRRREAYFAAVAARHEATTRRAVLTTSYDALA